MRVSEWRRGHRDIWRHVRRPVEEQAVDVSELMEDLEQWPSGTTLFNLSQNEVHIDIRLE